MTRIDLQKIENAVRMILQAIGENPNREGLLDTPARVARMYKEIYSGLHEDPAKPLEVIFKEEHNELVLVRDIPFFSTCEHHLVPFYGKVHIAYLPKGNVTGLSKLTRVVESLARRPQLQERMTSNIANIVMGKLNPQGTIVVVEAEHMCMAMRGVKKPGVQTVTTAIRGIYEEQSFLREEVMGILRQK
ncbi:GTP cyclohydrolase I FolE [Bacillus cereus]|uniref:GTP cyclohydrolase I FolE n=1 Tax=Bacillus cereus TaxID=1396 RepID=UPI000BECFF5C|nr:GTP cyclohydrolase I FolE [Bacillus cereus]PEA01231.1 GTP cyclohydrolase I FolE [Bacillus cereus]